MAARPGEELVTTLFADLHYYYGPPTAKPPHHRFDKGSYVYLFENASQRRARIEVANNAGTLEQDAFNGYLDGTHVQYSYKHTNLVTVTVDGAQNGLRGSSAEEWHLPTFDPRNETKYMYKLHTIDIYFWNNEDALQFVNGIRRVIPQHQITIKDEPAAPPPHADEMSPVVQQLENVAITDPSYSNGRTRDSRTTLGSSGPPISATPPNQATTAAFPGPPISATPQSQESSNFAPLAYNPAAPAAPEVIKHREKTPPPEDGASNPLIAAASSEYGQTYGGSFQQPGLSSPTPQQSYFPGLSTAGLQSPYSQPAPSAGLQSPYSQPLQSAGLQSPYNQPPPSAGPYAHSFQQPSAYSPPPNGNVPSYSTTPTALGPAPPSYQSGGQGPVTQYANYPGSPGFASPVITPGITSPGIYSPGVPPQPPASQVRPPPPGGFSNYTYSSNTGLSNTQPLMTDYSIHQQVYRPTEGEMAVKYKDKKPPAGKLEARADKVDKKVSGFLKKLEKKIG